MHRVFISWPRRSAISATSRCARLPCCARRPDLLRGHQGYGAAAGPLWHHHAARPLSRPQRRAGAAGGSRGAARRGARWHWFPMRERRLCPTPATSSCRAAIAENLPVTVLPGPSAALAALILSGLPPDVFLFAGFLPPRQAARRRALEGWSGLAATLVFFESPARLAGSLADMADLLGNRVRCCRPRADQAARGDPARTTNRACRLLSRAGPPRGEVVIVVGAARAEHARSMSKSTNGCGRHSPNWACATPPPSSPPRPDCRAASSIAGRWRCGAKSHEAGKWAPACSPPACAASRAVGGVALPLASAAARLADRRARLALPEWRDRYPGAPRQSTRDHRGQVAERIRHGGLGAVLPRQRRRIVRAAEAFLVQRPDLAGLDLQFDVMLVAPLHLPRHWRDAWRSRRLANPPILAMGGVSPLRVGGDISPFTPQ